jgi:hypothetical protein
MLNRAGRKGEGVVLETRDRRVFLAQITLATLAGIAASYGGAWWFGTQTPTLVRSYSILSIAVLGFGGGIALFLYVLWLALVEREHDPVGRVRKVLSRYLHPEFVAERLGPVLLTFAFLGAFSSLKILIPRIHPFSWDAAFSNMDRALFGTDPWRITHAVLGPSATRAIDLVYMMWVPVFWIAVLFFSAFAKGEMRRRFFLSFFAAWTLLGLVAATIFSSAGPCFLEMLGHPDASRYVGLFPLQNAHGSVGVQNYLAQGYLNHQEGVGRGISAMPSMHLAVVALYVCAARHYGRLPLALASLLYLLILVGSVHLGWHYAVDGIFGTLGVVVIWRLTRRSAPNVERSSIPVGSTVTGLAN